MNVRGQAPAHHICPGAPKDVFDLTPRRGFKYFDHGKFKKNSKLCTLGCKNSLITFFAHFAVWHGNCPVG